MKSQPHIILTVTNDLTYDQRMQRICTSLAGAGYNITLVGREMPNSVPLDKRSYEQLRLTCRYHSGKLFYLEYNWLLFRKLDLLIKNLLQRGEKPALCAIDLDTILPVMRLANKWHLPKVYDAHELFSELTEVKRRPAIYAIWKKIEAICVPQFQNGYTVNQFIAEELERRYGVKYEIIRNLPVRKTSAGEEAFPYPLPDQPFLLYQGAVNEGRSFETLIPAMANVNAELVIAGTGNFFEQANALVKKHGLEEKVIFLGAVKPDQLKSLTPLAYAGITIFENSGLNQYYSLANRYFDYIQAEIPQLCVGYPEYEALNNQHETALLINDLSPISIAQHLNKLLSDAVLYKRLKENCAIAARHLCWEHEATRLIGYWNTILPIHAPGD